MFIFSLTSGLSDKVWEIRPVMKYERIDKVMSITSFLSPVPINVDGQCQLMYPLKEMLPRCR
jgi:hypothetical protein